MEHCTTLINHLLVSETDRHWAARKVECILRHAAAATAVMALDERYSLTNNNPVVGSQRQGGITTRLPDEEPHAARSATTIEQSFELFVDGGWFLIGQLPL